MSSLRAGLELISNLSGLKSLQVSCQEAFTDQGVAPLRGLTGLSELVISSNAKEPEASHLLSPDLFPACGINHGRATQPKHGDAETRPLYPTFSMLADGKGRGVEVRGMGRDAGE